MLTLLFASLISPFFVELTPEVRTTYVSLGKIAEDRPMQVTNLRFGYDTGLFGRLGVRNWDVSSLTDRRAELHRHFLYHTEWGPTWQYDWEIAENWILKNDLTRSWTIYRGFENEASNATYHWWQLIQSLENPYCVPYLWMRRAIRSSDYFYFRVGIRRRFPFLESFYVTPSFYVDGGNARNQRRMFGENVVSGSWGTAGFSTVTFRLELGWAICSECTAFVFVEQYDVVGEDARASNAASSNPCIHNDWTLGGIGCRFRF